MANINTTATMKKDERDAFRQVQKDAGKSEKLMADAGCAGGEVVRVSLPLAPGSRDDVVLRG